MRKKMNSLLETGLWIFIFGRFFIMSNQEGGDYGDADFMNSDYFQLINGEPLFLNETYCLETVSAVVIRRNVHLDNNKNWYYIRISWASKNYMTSLKVESDSLNDSYCEAQNKHYYNRKPLNQTYHIFPDDVHEGVRFLPFKLDCKYVITPEFEGICRSVKFRYSVPVCYDSETCSCRDSVSPAPNVKIDFEKDGVFIFWSLPKYFGNISNFVFSIYQENGLNEKRVGGKKIYIKNEERDYKSVYKEFLKVNFSDESSYRIQSFFENDERCPGNSTFIRLRYPKPSNWLNYERFVLFTLVSACLIFFVVATFLIYWKKDTTRICLKLFRSESVQLPNVEYHSENLNHMDHKGFLLPQMISNSSYQEQSSVQDSYWFDYRNLVIKKEIGNGNFGVVFLASSSKKFKNCNEFAIKQIKDTVGSEGLVDFMEEIKTFKLVGRHPNVVRMLGYCGAPNPLTIIMEYVPHNLLKYLKNLRVIFEKRKNEASDSVTYAELAHSRSSSTIEYDYISQNEIEISPLNESEDKCSFSNIDYSLDIRDLELFGLQIARGMAHLESRNIIHRDLAARNVLMDNFKNLKISDFGMSRTGIYVNRSARKFPLRWMSPEALIERTYSNKSDVWSFGIVLWEIGTLGAFPYTSLQNEEVISFIKKGGHLEKPENITDQLYKVMKNCWNKSPGDRPNFKDLVNVLENVCQNFNGYVDFEELKPDYVFPATEEDFNKKINKFF